MCQPRGLVTSNGACNDLNCFRHSEFAGEEFGKERVAEISEHRRFSEVACHSVIDRRHRRRVRGDQVLRRQEHWYRTKVLLADFLKRCAARSPFDLVHIMSAPLKHKYIRSPIVADHGYKSLVYGNRHLRDCQVADRRARRKQQRSNWQEPGTDLCYTGIGDLAIGIEQDG